MRIGIPKETKKDEYRVAILPVGVEELVRSGHTVTLQKTAGSGSGLPDSAYEECGATIVNMMRYNLIYRCAVVEAKVCIGLLELRLWHLHHYSFEKLLEVSTRCLASIERTLHVPHHSTSSFICKIPLFWRLHVDLLILLNRM